MSEVVEEIVTEARKTFDLSARIKGRNLREGHVTVFTDEVAGAELGGDEEMKNAFGIVTGRNRWGALGDIAEAIAADSEADVTELQAAAEEAKAALEESALTFHLRAVPELVVKGARRAAKKAHGTLPDAVNEYNSTLYANLLASTIHKVVDADGAEQTGKLTVEAAADLEDYLPVHEYVKLVALLQEIQFKQAVSDSATGEASF